MKLKYSILFLTLASYSLQAFPSDRHKELKDSLPFTYERFVKQEGLKTTSSTTFTVYQQKDRIALEIPKQALNRDILVTGQVVNGFSSFVSNASGIVRFRAGNDIHTLFMTRNRSVDVQKDSTEVNMMEAIRSSNLLPVDMAFKILSEGKNGKSLIIDITNEVYGNGQLFGMGSNAALSHPDPSRSGLIAVSLVADGVCFSLYRSQTDLQNVTMTDKAEVATTLGIQLLLQLLPERRQVMKTDNPFYGFNVVTRQEYDTHTYVSRRTDYVCHWNLKANRQIVVYIDPVTPKPFVESIRKGFEMWNKAFAAIGCKQAFRFTSDASDASLMYNHILVRWGMSANGFNNHVITDPVSGEILAARINVMDAALNDLMSQYYLQCRHIDRRIRYSLADLDVRKDLFAVLMAGEVGKVLGVKENSIGYDVYSPSQLRSHAWLSVHGTTGSITAPLTFNYVAQSGDGLTAADLLPKVSSYDMDAIAYLYGNNRKAPSDRSAFYTYIDHLKNFKAEKQHLSNDWITAARLGIQQCRDSYLALDKDMAKLPSTQNSYEDQRKLYLSALIHYQWYVTNVARLVGHERILPVERGVNATRYNYSSRSTQLAALHFLEKEILTGIPQWPMTDAAASVSNSSISEMMRGVTVDVYKRLLDVEVIDHLVSAEERLGKETFTSAELFEFINRVLFEDFSETKPVPAFKRLVQANVVPDLAERVFSMDISLNLGENGASVLYAYFIGIANKISKLASSHPDSATRDNYRLIKMRMERSYFNKQH